MLVSCRRRCLLGCVVADRILTGPYRHPNRRASRLRGLLQQLMKTPSLLAVLLTAAACAAPRTVATPPAPVPANTAPARVTPAAPPAEAQRDWQLLDETIDGVPGISAERAERELPAGKRPARAVLVAVIADGVAPAPRDPRANM